MESLFGVPMGTLLVFLAVMFVGSMGALAALALRNPILVRLGLRKIPRSWGRSALIVAGLTLGTTIIAAALSTGDTMSHTFRNTARASLGQIDEMVGANRIEGPIGADAGETYFDERVFTDVRDALGDSMLVDGVAPAIMQPVVVQDLVSLQNEPRVGLFASDPAYMAGFGRIRAANGQTVTLDQLGEDEVYLNEDAAEELEAAPGHALSVFAVGEGRTYTVAAIVEYEGTGTADQAILMRLDQAQALLGRPGTINQVLISNVGDALGGAHHSDDVMEQLEPVAKAAGLTVEPVKTDAMDLAEEVALSFSTFFATFGLFSIVAGILLIFLVFVMLAAERRPEMGIARAVGTQRDQVVRMFLYEGLAYDLVAAAVGAALGVAVAFVMVFIMASALGGLGVDIQLDVRPRSLAVAYLLGVFLTFVTVAFSAWRVSSLNIVAAVRNLPERTVRGRGGRLWWLGLLAIVAGALMAAGGVDGLDYGVFSLGLTLAVSGTIPILRRLALNDRAAFTLPGVVLVVYYLLPSSVLELVLPELAVAFTSFVIVGVGLIIAATWVLMFNADIVVKLVMVTAGRVRALAPVLKLAVSRPLANRFRTGTTIAMFGMVVLTVVATSAITTAINNALDDIETFSGGFDLRATVLPTTPLEDPEAELVGAEGVDAGSIEVVGTQSVIAVEARQLGTDQEFESFPVFGFNDGFLEANPFAFALRAHGYASDEAVWEALRNEPNTALVTTLVVPTRAGMGLTAGLPDFQLQGFYLEDDGFDPVEVEVRDPNTGASTRLRVIGVLSIITPQEFVTGILTNQDAVAPLFGERTTPSAYWLALDENADVEAIASNLEAAFLSRGMEVDVMREVLDEVVASNRTFTYLVQGFLGLGLIVGVAALAVITARSVVERHRDLAVLRSIGFQRWMVYLLVLVETSFIALVGIALGGILGLVVSYNVVLDLQSEPSWQGVEFIVPWLNLAVLFAIVYFAAIVTSLLPARRATNVYPAEALRYE